MRRDLMKEERTKMAKVEVFNYFVNFESGDSCLVYVLNDSDYPKIGAQTIKRFAENVTDDKVLEVYHVPQDDLQYYCIGERIWIDTPEKTHRLIEIANKNN